MGDIVLGTGMIGAVRRTYPHAHIAWLVEESFQTLLQADEALDEVIVWPKKQWIALWRSGKRLEAVREVMRFRQRLRALKFDVAIDLQGLFKSGFLAWLSGATTRFGLGSKEGSQYFMSRVIDRVPEKDRVGPLGVIASEYRVFAESIGLDVTGFAPHLSVLLDVDERVADVLSGFGVVDGRFVVLAPFTTRPQKHWPMGSWMLLARAIVDQTSFTPVILGGVGDVDAASQIAAVDPAIVNLAGKTRMEESVAVIGRSALVIGVDTGLTHMGVALRRPTLAVFGSTHPYDSLGVSSGKVIWSGVPCSPCGRYPTCGGRFFCLTEITPERVFGSVVQLLTV
jgi:heptosyltransferase I